MTGTWEKFTFRDPRIPAGELTERVRAERKLPRTLKPVLAPGVTQPSVFDPALKQYGTAMRAGEPRFEDEAAAKAWRAGRREALEVVLAAIAGSRWADSLVLRGSMLLSAWFGAAAREPGDLDFVVMPEDWGVDDPGTEVMLTGIARAARDEARSREEAGLLQEPEPRQKAAGRRPRVRIIAEAAVSDDIWTYDRVPGRRLVLPWEPVIGFETAGGESNADTAVDIDANTTEPPASESAPLPRPGGWIQLDFVFNERLPAPPVPFAVPDSAAAHDTSEVGASALDSSAFAAAELGASEPGEDVDSVPRLHAASPSVSLAWKLLWLLSDAYPQGKDLYDAVLLAEHAPLDYRVLREAFVAADHQPERPVGPGHFAEFTVEWQGFRAEYPRLPASPQGHLDRLRTALAPTFALLDGEPASWYEHCAAWLEPAIARRGELMHASGLDAVLDELVQHKAPSFAAVVTVRELLGREETSVVDAYRLLTRHRDWRRILTHDRALAGYRRRGRVSRMDEVDGPDDDALRALGLDPDAPELASLTRDRVALLLLATSYNNPPEARYELRQLAQLPLACADPRIEPERRDAAVAILMGDLSRDRDLNLRRAVDEPRRLLRDAGLDGPDWSARVDALVGTPDKSAAPPPSL